MAAYRWVYDSRHPQADCQEPGSAPEPYTRRNPGSLRPGVGTEAVKCAPHPRIFFQRGHVVPKVKCRAVEHVTPGQLGNQASKIWLH